LLLLKKFQNSKLLSRSLNFVLHNLIFLVDWRGSGMAAFISYALTAAVTGDPSCFKIFCFLFAILVAWAFFSAVFSIKILLTTCGNYFIVMPVKGTP
jgi:hypothetical protein